jgi:hypothetical protein
MINHKNANPRTEHGLSSWPEKRLFIQLWIKIYLELSGHMDLEAL